MFTNAIAAAALTLAATWSSPAAAPLDDEPDYKGCATQGNHICAPGDDSPAGAGLYRDGQLIVPWTNYEDVEADPLNGVLPGTEYDNVAALIADLHMEGCWIEYKSDQTSELLYGDLALLPADATEVPCDQVDEALEYGQEPPASSPGGAPMVASGVEEDGSALYTDGAIFDPKTDSFQAPRWTPEYYGGIPGGYKCSTDAACSAYTRDFGGEYGNGTSPEKAEMWDGIPA